MTKVDRPKRLVMDQDQVLRTFSRILANFDVNRELSEEIISEISLGNGQLSSASRLANLLEDQQVQAALLAAETKDGIQQLQLSASLAVHQKEELIRRVETLTRDLEKAVQRGDEYKSLPCSYV